MCILGVYVFFFNFASIRLTKRKFLRSLQWIYLEHIYLFMFFLFIYLLLFAILINFIIPRFPIFNYLQRELVRVHRVM